MKRFSVLLVVLAAAGVLQESSAAKQSPSKNLALRGRHLAGDYCDSCAHHCTHCSCGECSGCKHGYFLEHNDCKECGGCDHIDHCSWCECNTCKECDDGHELNAWGECEEVYECDEHCEECHHGECKSCGHGHHLEHNECKKCGDCDDSCHDCDCGTCTGCGDDSKYFLQEDGKCYECGENHVLEHGECVEIQYVEEEVEDVEEFEYEAEEHTTVYPRPHRRRSHPRRGRASARASCDGPRCQAHTSVRTGPGFAVFSSSSSSG